MSDAPSSPPYAIDLPATAKVAKSPKLGQIAFLMALAVLVLSVLASVLIGLDGTTITSYNDTVINNSGGTSQSGFRINPNQAAAGAQGVIGSIFGIWALVQGIIATVQNRGRRFGIIAIILAATAPILSAVVWSVVGGIAGHHVTQ
jgi:hypothetical protein